MDARFVRARATARDDLRQAIDDSSCVAGKLDSRPASLNEEASNAGSLSSREVRSQCLSRKIGMSENALNR